MASEFPYQVTVTKFNPYSWDNTSSLVSSNVVNVVIKNHKGETLKVEESKKDIEIKIPREVHAKEEEDKSLFIKPSSEGKMQYHKVYVKEENSLRLKVNMYICYVRKKTEFLGFLKLAKMCCIQLRMRRNNVNALCIYLTDQTNSASFSRRVHSLWQAANGK